MPAGAGWWNVTNIFPCAWLVSEPCTCVVSILRRQSLCRRPSHDRGVVLKPWKWPDGEEVEQYVVSVGIVGEGVPGATGSSPLAFPQCFQLLPRPLSPGLVWFLLGHLSSLARFARQALGLLQPFALRGAVRFI